MTTAQQELETLSVPERVQIVEDLWDSIARSNANLPIPQWQKDELARRKKRYQQNPDTGETWDQVKRSILRPRSLRRPSFSPRQRQTSRTPTCGTRNSRWDLAWNSYAVSRQPFLRFSAHLSAIRQFMSLTAGRLFVDSPLQSSLSLRRIRIVASSIQSSIAPKTRRNGRADCRCKKPNTEPANARHGS